MGVSNGYLQDLKVNDLISLFYLHKIIESKKMSEHRIRQGKRLIKRFTVTKSGTLTILS